MPIGEIIGIAGGMGLGRIVGKIVDKVSDWFSGDKKEKSAGRVSPSSPSPTSIIPVERRPIQQEIVYFEKESRRGQEYFHLQQELANYRKAEVEAGIKMASAEARRQEWALQISEKNLELRQQELMLIREQIDQNKKLQQFQRGYLEQGLKLRSREIELIEEGLQDQKELGLKYLDLMREKEAKNIEVKLQEIQSHWDERKWAGILSQQDMQRIFLDVSERHRLVLILSHPQISESCPPEIINNLPNELSSELKSFVETYYPTSDELSPVQFFGKFFDKPIGDAEARKLETLFSPIPAAIIYSSITDEKVYIHVSFAGLPESLSDTLTWFWDEAYQKLLSEGNEPKQSLKIVRKTIVEFHQWLAAFLTDLYYLYINPNHVPRIYVLETNAPEEIRVFFEKLRSLQQARQKNYQTEVVELSVQVTEQAKRQREAEAAKKQQLEEDRRKEAARLAAEQEAQRLEEEETLRLGIYAELRDLLRASKWAEADEKTNAILLKEVERTSQGVLDVNSSNNLPAEKIQLVDTLWTKYSNNRFGLSIQKQIFDECGKVRFSFAVHVGWSPDYANLSLRNSIKSPEGHLPARIYTLKPQTKINKWDDYN